MNKTASPSFGFPSAQKSCKFCALRNPFSPCCPARVDFASAQKSRARFQKKILFYSPRQEPRGAARWIKHRDKLWMLESGDGSLGVFDLNRGKYEAIAHLPEFTRSLTLMGQFAFVG